MLCGTHENNYGFTSPFIFLTYSCQSFIPLPQPDTCGKLWNARDGNAGKAGLFNIELLKFIDIVHITASELLTEL